MIKDSKRLSYRHFLPSEFKEYFSWYGNTEVMEKVTGKPLSLEEAKARFELAMAVNEERQDAGFFSVHLKTNMDFMGIVKFTYLKKHRVEVGYGSLPIYWGKRYASEMLEALLNHAKKDEKIKELVGIVSSNNSASRHILETHNFQVKAKKSTKSEIWYSLKI